MSSPLQPHTTPKIDQTPHPKQNKQEKVRKKKISNSPHPLFLPSYTAVIIGLYGNESDIPFSWGP